ncbi:MAG: rhamnogalacturonan acetylesterase [Candidatus Pedobacter colombiensis]|uniref:Rhamnogalacturonan acetylesterase n=1 Tax=Candidatus Pedobacter colombiensis TaxID=3121371 RepID=A0AAJ5W9J1_9SPHI|nr:rhamnogalacturonan acetylesterase [Pedobacter sp.]WEK20165.1 MAG: rhamnogalacturonan acetylesterase [Pedobacter sp.]
MKSNRTYLNLISIVAFILLASCVVVKVAQKPTLFLIGDSTVKNGKGKGDGSLWGWGSYLADFFDLNKINVENHALGGTSTRTFQSKGLWDSVLVKLKPGDYVIMQFGHNDGSPLDDTARARGTIKGIGPEHKEIFNPITKQKEVVYTYGWYLRKFIHDAKAKGATAIVCSPIPRNPVKNGVLALVVDDYAAWAEEVATAEKVGFIPLNKIIKDKYAALGAEKVNAFFTEKDHTHTNEAGAKVNAVSVVEGLKVLNSSSLIKYLKN